MEKALAHLDASRPGLFLTLRKPSGRQISYFHIFDAPEAEASNLLSRDMTAYEPHSADVPETFP